MALRNLYQKMCRSLLLWVGYNTSHKLNFDQLFQIPLFALKLNRAHPDIKKDMKWFLLFFLMYGAFTLPFCLIMYTTITVDIPNRDFNKICANGIIGPFYLFTGVQYFCLMQNQERLRRMFAMMRRDYANAEADPDTRNVVLEYTARARWVTKLWLAVDVVTSLQFIVKSCYKMLISALLHDFRYFDIYELSYSELMEALIQNNGALFALLNLFQLWYLLYAATTYLGLFPLGPIFMLHACGQLQLVKRRVNTFFPKDGCRNEDTIKNMKSCAKQLMDIYEFVENINGIFQYIYEIYMKGTASILPIAALIILQNFTNGISYSPQYLIIVSTFLIITYIPCYYSELLRGTAESVGEALYMSGWEMNFDRRERTMTLMLLQRMNRPVVVSAVFRTLCFGGLADVYKEAFAIFNVLNAVWG